MTEQLMRLGADMYDNEENELYSLKRDDSYFYSIPFEWDIKDDDGEWKTLSTTMDVNVEWSDFDVAYKISFTCPDEDEIVACGSSLTECYNDCVRDEVVARLNSEGVATDVIYDGGYA